jgi:hypothetical protein
LTPLQKLAVERVKELGDEAYRVHQELLVWRPEGKKLDSKEETAMRLAVQRAFEGQHEWCQALLADGEET